MLILSNGRLEAEIRRESGVISKVLLDGKSLLGSGTGYWSMSASSGSSQVDGFGHSQRQFISIDPAANGGSRTGSRLVVLLNDRHTGNIGPLPEDGVMHRDSYCGFWFEHSLPIKTKDLIAGRNTLEFRLEGTTWHQSVLCDFICLKAID